MSYFADIFDAYQKRTHAKDEHSMQMSLELAYFLTHRFILERQAANDFLAQYRDSRSPGRMRADPDGDKFTIK